MALAIVTITAIVFGGGFGLLEYLDKKKESQISNTLDLVKRFQTTEVLETRQTLDEAWSSNYSDLLEVLSPAEEPPDYDVSKAYKEYVMGFVERYKFSVQINLILEFYEQVVICVNASICDVNTVNDFFLRNGKVFFRKFYPYVCNQRRKWNDPSAWSDAQNYFTKKDPNSNICR